MTEAALGTGTRILFATSGFTADILEYSFSRISRRAVRTTHFLTPVAGANQFGGETFMPVKLVDPGYLTLTVAFSPQRPPPIMGAPELLCLSFPCLPYTATESSWEFYAFMTAWRIGIPVENKMTASIELKLTGLVDQIQATDNSTDPLVLIAHWDHEDWEDEDPDIPPLVLIAHWDHEDPDIPPLVLIAHWDHEDQG